VNANDAAYRHKNVDPDFSDRLNGARKPKATKAERTARDAERAAAAVTKQELAMSQADGLTQMGHGGLGNLIRAGAGIVNWEACVAAVTDEDITTWAKWRGRSEDSIRQFVERKCYGKYDGAFALPIRDNDSGKVVGVHYRPDLRDKAWRVYPIGTPQTPIIHGNPAEAELVIIAESPFDMDRLIDELQLWNNTEPWAAICTKGAGNAWAVPDVLRPEAKILVAVQRDEPAKKWLSDLGTHLMRPLCVLKVPNDADPKINDIDDWFRYGGADPTKLKELLKVALAYPRKPILILPSAGVPIISCAEILFKGLAKQKTHFVRNGELVSPRESSDGLHLRTLLKTEFATDIERPFDLQKYVETEEGPKLKPSRCGVENAQLLLHTREMQQYSLPLRSVAASPVLIVRNGKPVVLQKGYHRDEEGLFVAKNLDIPEVALSEGVALLTKGLFADYKWVSESDLSRAVAQVISPALKLGNFLPGADFPIDLGLADQSQAGKTLRMKIAARIYGENAYTVINKRGGVGSLDETLATALCSGRLFISIDNVRGEIDSQLLESTLRGTGSVPVRLPYRSEILVRTDRVIVQLSSNSANLTKDLANRCIITNSRKQSGDYRPHLPWGQEFIRLLEDRQPTYLGAVHAVVREWILRGKPRTHETRHDFRDWVQSLDWIVQNIFQLPPLMNDHSETQSRLSNKVFSWFREVVLGIVRANKNLPVTVQATDIRDVCDAYSIVIPGLRGDADDEARNQFLGRLLAQVFSDSETVVVEEFSATRFLEKGSHKPIKKYSIAKTARPIIEVQTEVKSMPNVETTVIDEPPAAEPKSEIPAPPYSYVTEEAQLPDAVRDLAQPGAIALDIETYYPDARVTKEGKRMKVSVDTICDRYKSEIRLLQLYRDGSDLLWLIDIRALEKTNSIRSTSFQAIRDILAEREIVGHNATCFDLAWCWEHLQIRAKNVKDTMTAHRLLLGGVNSSDAPADLGSVFEIMLQLDLLKDQGSSDWGTDQLTTEQLVYAAHDVFHLHELLRKQEAELVKADLSIAWELEQRLAPIVVDMTNRGMAFDIDSTPKVKYAVEQRLDAAKQKALAWFGLPDLNLDAPGQLLQAFQNKGITLPNTKSATLGANDSEGAELVLEYRNIRDHELKFVESAIEATRPDGRIHATFNPVGAETGRLSSKDPNLQSIPRPDPKNHPERFPIRELFRVAPGKKLVIADFSQMELVAAAVIAPEPVMLDAFQNKQDLHCRTASVLLGRPITKADKDERSLAKAVNFGLLYGQKGPGLKKYAKNDFDVDMTENEANQFYEEFFREYPGLAAWHAQAKRDANDEEVIEVRTLGVGRRQYIGDQWWNRFTALLNTPIQGSCAEATKLALFEIDRQLQGRADLVNCVHDEIIVECDETLAPTVKKEVERIMMECSELILNGITIEVEADIADTWADKGGKPSLMLAALPPAPATYSIVPTPEPVVKPVVKRAAKRAAKAVELLAASSIAYPAEILAFQPTVGFDKLWYWVKERHAIYNARREGKPSPWTTDPLLSQYKFTNVFRELDRESQACIRIANSGASLVNFDEQFLRCILFKTFNLDSTWQVLTAGLGEEPNLANFDLNRNSAILSTSSTTTIYSSAYYGAYPCTDKNWRDVGLAREETSEKFHLRVVEMMIAQGIPAKALAAQSLDQIAALLQSFPRIGDFKAGQFALDLDYGPHLRLPVDKFVIAGTGARNGVDRCFTAHGKRYDAVIRLVRRYQDECSLAAIGSKVPRLRGRAPAPMTVQNWFCEISKYLRGYSKNKYSVPAGTIKPLPEPILPPWW
jgi:DNA polymerase-1